jgi:hypothetical protein
LFTAPQPSVEQAGDAVVYTEAMTPLVQMLCRGSLLKGLSISSLQERYLNLLNLQLTLA